MTGRERICAQIDGNPVDRLPVMPILMQFAADRIGARYLDYEMDYRLLVESQLRCSAEFDLDHVNTMSDPACEAADCGAAVKFHPDLPAAMDDEHSVLADKARLASLQMPDPESGRMGNRLKALALYRERGTDGRMIEGWIEGPCAEAVDLRGMSRLMLDLYDDPSFVRDLFDFVLEMELAFAKAQVEAGAEMMGIGDAAASLISPRFYTEYVWPFEKQMVERVQELGARARLHICGNTRRLLKGMGELGCDVVDLDFLAPLDEARSAMGPGQVLLGNIDPVHVLREGTPDKIYAAMADCHRLAGPRYIVGAGCEVTRDTPDENLRAMLQYAKDHAPGDIPVRESA